MPRPLQDEFPFASLDFPGRTTLRVSEVAERLGIVAEQVIAFIEQGELGNLNISAGTKRRHMRIPIEAYRDFIIRRIDGPSRPLFLKTLPPATLRQIQREINHILEA